MRDQTDTHEIYIAISRSVIIPIKLINKAGLQLTLAIAPFSMPLNDDIFNGISGPIIRLFIVGDGVVMTTSSSGGMVGFELGLTLGFELGLVIGDFVGLRVGFRVGIFVGVVGGCEGMVEGIFVGLIVGGSVGDEVGTKEGGELGLCDGASLGERVG